MIALVALLLLAILVALTLEESFMAGIIVGPLLIAMCFLCSLLFSKLIGLDKLPLKPKTKNIQPEDESS
jgi:hypothetical protein